jgi:hypothetical protein
MKVAILGSRDQLCVNPAVMQAPSSREKLNMCQEFVKIAKIYQLTKCQFYKDEVFLSVLRIRIFLDLPDPHPDTLGTSTDPIPDPFIIKKKF